MAKSILLSVLTRVLGEYVNGITEENLKLGVWAGKISLNNLELNRNMLDKLNLPVDILQGSLRNLEITIPWTALDSSPVTMVLDGIYLTMSPLDISSFSVEDVKMRLAENKRYKLRQSDRILDLFMQAREQANVSSGETSAAAGATTVSFLQGLTSRIIDNIEIVIKNIHVCYVDNISLKGSAFSCGITLDNFTVKTTDRSWKKSFINRNPEEPLFKVAELNNVGIYCSVDSKTQDLHGVAAALAANKTASAYLSQKWEKVMDNMIYREVSGKNSVEAHESAQNISYVLIPRNSLSVKLIHSEKLLDLTRPRFDIDVQTNGLHFNINKMQYRQMLVIIETQKSLEYQQQLYAQRPSCRPIGHSKIWWRYAYTLVAGKLPDASNKVGFACNHFYERCTYANRYCFSLFRMKS